MKIPKSGHTTGLLYRYTESFVGVKIVKWGLHSMNNKKPSEASRLDNYITVVIESNHSLLASNPDGRHQRAGIEAGKSTFYVEMPDPQPQATSDNNLSCKCTVPDNSDKTELSCF